MKPAVIKVQLEDLAKDRRGEPSICAHCRKLQKEGVSNKTWVESYRGKVLSLRTQVREGVKWTTNESERESVHFVPYKPMTVESKARLRKNT